MSDLANNTDTIEMAEVFTVKERTRTAPSLNPDQALVPRDQDNDFDTGQVRSSNCSTQQSSTLTEIAAQSSGH
jgi:hypothetical protein